MREFPPRPRPQNPEILACKEARRKSDIAGGYTALFRGKFYPSSSNPLSVFVSVCEYFCLQLRTIYYGIFTVNENILLTNLCIITKC